MHVLRQVIGQSIERFVYGCLVPSGSGHTELCQPVGAEGIVRKHAMQVRSGDAAIRTACALSAVADTGASVDAVAGSAASGSAPTGMLVWFVGLLLAFGRRRRRER